MMPLVSYETQPYEYTPLQGPRYIRLLNLEPALNPDAPLHVTLLQADHAELEGQYESVSYHWGDPTLDFPVYLNQEYYLCVTKNLDRALRRLRLQQGRRLLWVDAVCINQCDNKEKEVQIPLMVHIFRGASRVLAWLGPGGPDSDEEKGIQFLNQLSRRHRNAIEALEEHLSDEAHDRETMVQALLDPIRKFFNLTWFSRRWIVQEVVFNLEVLFICGTSELPWVRFISAVSVLRNATALYSRAADRKKLEAIDAIASLWKQYCNLTDPRAKERQRNKLASEDNTDDILELMEKFNQYDCSDPRDRIFALYSMTTSIQPTHSATILEFKGYDISGPRERSIALWSMAQRKQSSRSTALLDTYFIFMDADYTLDVTKTYKTCAIACLKAGKGRQILDAVLSRTGPRPRFDWPSWVPDWRKHSTMEFHLPNEVHFSRTMNEKIVLYIHGVWQEQHLPIINASSSGFHESGETAYTFITQMITAVCPDPVKAHAFLTGLLVIEPLMKQLARNKDPPEYLESLELLIRLRHFFVATISEMKQKRRKPPVSHTARWLSDFIGGSIDETYQDPEEQMETIPERFFIGCGTLALMPGDRVLDLYEGGSGALQEPYLFPALILRPRLEPDDLEFQCIYQIVGAAYVSYAWSNGERQIPTWSSHARKICLE